MKDFFENISDIYEHSPILTIQILKTILVIFVLWFVYSIAVRISSKRIKNKKTAYKWKKNLSYISAFIGLIFLTQIWFSALGNLTTYLGLLSAGIAIALKDPLTDLVAWMFIIFRTPFDIGDRIEIGNSKGDIIDIRPFKFTILEVGNWVDAEQSTGRVIHIPNHTVFSEHLANYTADFEFVWNELNVVLTYDSNWKKAKSILEEIAEDVSKQFIETAKQQINKAAKSYLIEYKYLTPIVYTDVKDRGIFLTIRHLIDPRRRRGTSHKIWECVLTEFENHNDIVLAYPTFRILNSAQGGKLEPNKT